MRFLGRNLLLRTRNKDRRKRAEGTHDQAKHVEASRAKSPPDADLVDQFRYCVTHYSVSSQKSQAQSEHG